jgi:hypothetical protein
MLCRGIERDVVGCSEVIDSVEPAFLERVLYETTAWLILCKNEVNGQSYYLVAIMNQMGAISDDALHASIETATTDFELRMRSDPGRSSVSTTPPSDRVT